MWADTLELEVAAAFRSLCIQPWVLFEEKLWQARKETDHAWTTHAKWWRKTTRGRQQGRAYSQARAKKLSAQMVAWRMCRACGSRFEISAYQQERKRDSVCSTACRGRMRGNIKLHTIDGVSMTLTAWCEQSKVQLKTAHARLRRGWPIREALGMDQQSQPLRTSP